MVKNAPCNAEVMGSTPGQGTKIPHAMEQLSLRVATAETVRARARTPQLDSLCIATKDPAWHREDPMCCSQDLTQPNK